MLVFETRPYKRKMMLLGLGRSQERFFFLKSKRDIQQILVVIDLIHMYIFSSAHILHIFYSRYSSAHIFGS